MPHVPHIYRSLLFTAAFFLTCAYSLGRGGKPERAAAGIMLGGLLLTWLLIAPIVRRYHGAELGVAFADLLMLVGFVWLALTADRFWPLWLAAIQIVVVMIHLSMVLRPFTLPSYYKNTSQLWSYPLVGILAIGTLRHRLRIGASPWERWIGRVAAQLTRPFTGWRRDEQTGPTGGQ